MKIKFILTLLLLSALSGCGMPADWDVDNSAECNGTDALVISNLTPTVITIPSGSSAKHDVGIDIIGAHCEPVSAYVRIQNTTIEFEGQVPFSAYHLSLRGVTMNSSVLSGTTGTWTVLISTPTQTSNTLTGTWAIQ